MKRQANNREASPRKPGPTAGIVQSAGSAEFAVPGSTTSFPLRRLAFAVWVLVVASSFAGTAWAQNPATLQAPTAYNGSTRTVPNSVAMGDFNGDGLLDFAVVEINPTVASDGQVEIFLGNADGSFTSKGAIPVGTIGGQQFVATHTIAVGYFNGPGTPLGIAVAVNQALGCTQGGVVVLFGNGDGTFQSPVCLPDTPGVNGVVVADFFGSGYDGIAAATASGASSSIVVHQSSGQSSFPNFYSIIASPPGNTSVVLNGMVYAGRYGNGTLPNLVLIANDGLFTQYMIAMQSAYSETNGFAVFYSFPESTGSGGFTDVGFADMNGDQIQDIVGLSNDYSLRYFPVTISEGSNEIGSLTSIGGPTGLELSLGDFNGNGIADFAVLTATQNLSITLDVPCYNSANPLCKTTPPVTASAIAPFGPAGQGLASGYSTGLSQWVIVDSGVYQILNSSSQEVPEARSIAVYLVNPATGQPTLAPLFTQPSTQTTGTTQPAFAVADLNGDGSPDVAVLGEDEANFSATVTPFQNVYQTSGAPGFAAQPDFDLGKALTTGGSLNGFAIVAGQFRSAANNPSGLPDLALVLPEGITLLENQGNFQFALDTNCQGVFSPATNCYLGGNANFPGFSSTSPTRPAVLATDVSGDGIADIVLAVPEYCNTNDSGGVEAAIFVLISNGDGTFQPPVYYPSPVVNPVGLAAGKLLGHNVPDLVVTNGGEVCTGSKVATGSITTVAAALLPNLTNGSGEFGTAQTLVSQASDVALPDVSAVAIADMNGDGALDVVLSASDGIHVLLNNPVGTFTDQGEGIGIPLYGPADTVMNAAQIDIADFNGDGFPDVAAAIDGIVYVFPGNGAGGLNSPNQGFASGPNSGQLKAIDVNGDGFPDVLVSNSQGFSVVLNDEYALPPAPPVIAGISPASGPAAGGEAVTIAGQHFQAKMAVFFASTEAMVTAISPTSISVVAPALTPGIVSVTVTNPSGQSATIANAFTALGPPPSIASVNPNSGSAGNTIMIAGQNFQNNATVLFGSTQATVTAITATSISTVVPVLTPGPVSVTVTNPDGQSATITNGFTTLGSAPPIPITVTETIIVNDAPGSLIPDSEKIKVNDAVTVIAVNPPINVAAPVVVFSPSSVGFSNQNGSQQIQISNEGSGPEALLKIDSFVITGMGSSVFSPSQLACPTPVTSFPITLPSQGACVLTISYAAPSTGSATGQLIFTDNAALSNLPSNATSGTYTQTIQLSGSGTSITAPPPSATVSISDNETITVTDTPAAPLIDREPITVTDQVSVTAKDTPTVTWATPTPITYGTALSDKQLDATFTYNGKPVAGTKQYSPAAGTVLDAGTQTLSVTFTPKLAKDFATVTATVTLQVNQAVPKITWAKPAAITYGTALSSTQLDATASVAGVDFVYSPAAGEVLDAGSQPLTVTFTPTDTTDYTTATMTATLKVNKAHSTIAITVMPNPALVNKAVMVGFQVTGTGVGPTGSVTVTASSATRSTQTCTGRLSAGAGNCSLTFSTAGNRTLKAVYTGDSNFDSSTSNTVVEKVEQ